MKKENYVSKTNIPRVLENRSFRRWVKRLFASRIKSQQVDCLGKLQNILRKLQDLEDLIDIVAREIQRQAKRRE